MASKKVSVSAYPLIMSPLSSANLAERKKSYSSPSFSIPSVSLPAGPSLVEFAFRIFSLFV